MKIDFLHVFCCFKRIFTIFLKVYAINYCIFIPIVIYSKGILELNKFSIQ